MSSFVEKAKISAFAAFVFGLVNMLKIDNPLQNVGIFFVITLLSMGNPTKKTGIKLKHSFYGTLIFFFVSSPAVVEASKSIFGNNSGIILNSLMYFIIVFIAMYLPEENK